MDLVTTTNKKYIINTINLINSYKINSYNNLVYVYYFDCEEKELEQFQKLNIKLVEIPKVCYYAHEPSVFFYKVYAINHYINNFSNSFIYSDATNVFNKFVDLQNYMIDSCLLLPYNNNKLLNKFWTTRICFEKMQCNYAKIMPQYWAGFQAYNITPDNLEFIQEMYEYMLDPEVALPNTSIKKPDGINGDCVEHRQDQSVLSILISKKYRHQNYDHEKQLLFGDWQTFSIFDSNYKHDLENCALSSRESKNGFLRFI